MNLGWWVFEERAEGVCLFVDGGLVIRSVNWFTGCLIKSARGVLAGWNYGT